VTAVVVLGGADDKLRGVVHAVVAARDGVLDDEAVADVVAGIDHFDAEEQFPSDVILGSGRDGRAAGRDDLWDVRVARRVALELLDRADISIRCPQAGADELQTGVADEGDRRDDRWLTPVQSEHLEPVGEHRADGHRRRPAVGRVFRHRPAVEERSITTA
jgi:hypothetical protein